MDIDWDSLRVHGNGFIQIDIDDNRRLHIWDHRIPKQKVATPIHDHRFDFTSRVLKGTLWHTTYNIRYDEDGDYEIYIPEVRKGEDTILVSSGDKCVVSCDKVISIPEGGSYEFGAMRFHETGWAEPTVTLMTKLKTYKFLDPRVLVKHGFKPDNDFHRYAYEDLQTIVDEALIGVI